MGIAKPCTHLHLVPSTSTQLHPSPSTSTQLISTSTQLHPPPPSTFKPPLRSLQHLQPYKNQNIARNWAISPNLGQKIQKYLFCLKIGTHGIMEELVPNPHLEFWNSDPWILFWANLGRKSQNCLFCLKIGTHGILEEVILDLDLDFQNPDTKSIFVQIWAKKVKVGRHSISKMLIFILALVFWISNPKSICGQVWDKRVKAVCFAWKLAHTQYLEDVDSYFVDS